MTDAEEKDGALKRFRRWKDRLPKKTFVLAHLVETILVPKITAADYVIQKAWFNDPEACVGVNEIHFERRGDSIVDYITISFAKYGRPKFQVLSGKRRASAPFERLLKGNLVRQPKQYYHFWGKPWWIPRAIWTDQRAENLVKSVGEKLDCLFLFLDTGERNSNISQPLER